MTSERIALLSALTACMFAFSIYMQNNLFLLPFGLFKIGLFVAFILMLINERKRPVIGDWLVLIWTLLFSGTSKFILQFFFNEQAFEQGYDTIEFGTSLLLIAGSIVFFAWSIWMVYPLKNAIQGLLLVAGLGALICFLSNSYAFLILPVILGIVGVSLHKELPNHHRSFYYLFGFVVVSTWISAYFLGTDQVLGNL